MASRASIIACGPRTAVIALVLKFLAGPAIMATAAIIVGLRRSVLKVAIVQVTSVSIFSISGMIYSYCYCYRWNQNSKMSTAGCSSTRDSALRLRQRVQHASRRLEHGCHLWDANSGANCLDVLSPVSIVEDQIPKASENNVLGKR
ncbi:hypothetical protein SAY86_024913 [Trapa natans]|uniref:Uncharacterized protein n=1 Tax=Trapa natans TaxID=22666 RepID=A0AAN7RK75_TRANT|nr:hypothetical protein SAY86_024913 [Trapa natans]